MAEAEVEVWGIARVVRESAHGALASAVRRKRSAVAAAAGEEEEEEEGSRLDAMAECCSPPSR